ncbi:T9SS type A sorting domain-containing protein [Fulvivirga lutimaris]|uniref:T9SS type A sorting domain-containing protein n=1 Tax=Fulvivirga lutimaris TaxID=1819566 RepID=UPI0012BD0FBE|nr:T9SS type A sorting domain-containing protein [Fulvivirga lutimaris]MTI38445.1 T9SS type A sorting domain-containing protein [Fulvivirga lutimaris]
MLRKLHLIITFAISTQVVYGQNSYTSNDNYTGLWSDDATWSHTPAASPLDNPGNATHGSASNIDIYGYIRSAITLDIAGQGPTVTIHDTLFVDGDLNMSQGTISLGAAAVLIVTGDLNLSNGAFNLNNTGRIVVGGNLSVTNGNVNNSNNLYVYGTSNVTGGGQIDGCNGYGGCSGSASSPYENIKDENDLETEDEDLFNFVENGGVLPVELIEFNGFTSQSILHLNWKTASEVNFDYFQIEYAEEDLAFKPFHKTIKGHGNSANVNNYQFNQQISGKQGPYYRLKIVDFDGAYEYSDVIFVNNSIPSSAVEVFPNPNVSGRPITFNCFQCEESSPIEIFDLSYNKVFEGEVDFINQPKINPRLASGVYTIRITIKGESLIKRLVITN